MILRNTSTSGDFFTKGIVNEWERLEVGDTWKIGTTLDPLRYSEKWLQKWSLKRNDEFTGPPQAAYVLQIMKLGQHKFMYGEFPLGNTKWQ